MIHKKVEHFTFNDGTELIILEKDKIEFICSNFQGDDCLIFEMGGFIEMKKNNPDRTFESFTTFGFGVSYDEETQKFYIYPIDFCLTTPIGTVEETKEFIEYIIKLDVFQKEVSEIFKEMDEDERRKRKHFKQFLRNPNISVENIDK
ncbi:hypothetical protein [Bacillus cereus group sp. BceL008]|uniref:hypothetical protein n=1 Tax=Bacillus cereus group sp. BceL008 TaxID=3445220 RepID=UPI003F21D7D1